MRAYALCILGLALASSACGSAFVSGETGGSGGGGGSGPAPPADVSGAYTVAITNGDNGCNFGNWDTGESVPSIPFTITQDGADITGTVGGYVGDFMKASYGSNVFTGTIAGTSFTMTNKGTHQFNSNGCVATIDIIARGELTGDAIQGTLTYDPETNGDADCGQFNDCTSTQQFAGSRPPKP